MSANLTATPADLRTIEKWQAEVERANPSPFPHPPSLIGERRRLAVKPWVAPEDEPTGTDGPSLCKPCRGRGVRFCVSCGVTNDPEETAS